MDAKADRERTLGGTRDGRDVAAAEADQRQMRLERCQRGRSVAAGEVTGEAEGDTGRGVDCEVGVAARLAAEQRVPGLICGDVCGLDGRQKGVEQAQKRRALGVVGKNRLDVLERILKPRRLKVAVAVEQADGLAQIDDLVAQPGDAHAASPVGAVTSALPALRLSVPEAAESPRGVRARSAA